MENAAAVHIQHVLFLGIFICIIGMLAGKLASRLKLPDVVLFIVAGIIVGQGLHIVNEASSSFLNQFILTVGSAVILFDGGRNIRLSGLRKVWLSLTMLAVPGVLITVAVVGVAIHYIFGMPYLYAFLIGSVIASTDPATIIPVFKQVTIRAKVRETVESESAFNDATGSIITFTLLDMILHKGESLSIPSVIGDFLITSVGGLLVGAVVGLAVVYLVAHLHIGILRDYATIAMLVTSLGAYLLGDWLHVSGLMATFVAGIMWGNTETFGLKLEDKYHEIGLFSENITTIMRMLIFILLGSQVNLRIIFDNLLPSLAVVAVLMFIARPLTVYLSTLPDRKADWQRNERLFMIWVRETGVIPAALSGMIAGTGIAYTDKLTAITFMAILLTILIQAGTTAIAARKLGLEVSGADHEKH